MKNHSFVNESGLETDTIELIQVSYSLDHWSDTFALTYSTIICPIGLILNLILLYVSMKSTPKEMATYSIVIRLGVICDIFLAIVCFTTTTRIFSNDRSTLVMMHGPCEHIFSDRWISSIFCFYMYCSEIHCFMFSHFILIYSYLYRARVVVMPFDQVNEYTVRLGCYILAVLYFVYYNIIFYDAVSPQEVVNEEVMEVRPELINSTWLYNGVIDTYRPTQMLTGLMSIFSSAFVLVIGGYCTFKINRSLSRLQNSPQIKKMHRSLLKVLLSQTISPIVSVITVIINSIYHEIPSSRSPITENMITIPIISVTVVSPMVTCFFIEPYREYVLKKIGMNFRKTVSDVVSSNKSNKY